MFKNLKTNTLRCSVKKSVSLLIVLTFLFTTLYTSSMPVLASQNNIKINQKQTKVGKISLNKEKIIVEKNGLKTVYSEKGNTVIVEKFNKAGKKVKSEKIVVNLSQGQTGSGVITPRQIQQGIAALTALLARFSIYFTPTVHLLDQMAARSVSSLAIARIILFGTRYYDSVGQSIIYYYNSSYIVLINGSLITVVTNAAIKYWRWTLY